MFFLDFNDNGGEGLLGYLEALRKPLLLLGAVVLLLSGIGYCFSFAVMRYLKQVTGVELAAFGLPDAFLAHVAIAIGMACLVLVPALIHILLMRMAELTGRLSRRMCWGFWSAAVVLFYAGVGFCLRLTLPYGARFLLSFADAMLQPVISVTAFVQFCALFLFGFGLIFELPLGMILLGKIGLVRRSALARQRRYAILAITIVSAILTPTPDVFNLMLMAVPLYALFEVGLIGMRLTGSSSKTPTHIRVEARSSKTP
jgi:sec-independent protein translocase protein TatC